jgi:hypothetical protein
LKKGDFDSSLIKAIVANGKLSLLEGLEKNETRAVDLMEGFIQHRDTLWNEDVAELDEQATISKQEIVAVANKYMKDNNYVLLYKRKGEDKNIVKVEKPPITPVETNAGKQSAFVKKIAMMPVSPVTRNGWTSIRVSCVRRRVLRTCCMFPTRTTTCSISITGWTWAAGMTGCCRWLRSTCNTWGRQSIRPSEIAKAFYDIACNFSVNATTQSTMITITGLQENFGRAVALFEDVMRNCLPDSLALVALKDRLLKARANNKLNKNAIMQGLISYARYGAKNPLIPG